MRVAVRLCAFWHLAVVCQHGTAKNVASRQQGNSQNLSRVTQLMSSGECCEVTINWFHRGKEVRMQRNDGRSGVTLFISYCIRQTDVFQAPGPPTGPMYIRREASITAHLFLYLQDLHEDKHGRVFSLYFLCPSHTMQLLLFSLI